MAVLPRQDADGRIARSSVSTSNRSAKTVTPVAGQERHEVYVNSHGAVTAVIK